MIELIIVISVILILTAIAVPAYRQHVLRAREVVLKEDLDSMRRAIDQFTQDKVKAPQSLDDLVSAGYLRALPKDPITGQTDWVPVQDDSLLSADQTEPGISDVHSAAQGNASDGTAYASW